MQRCNSPFTVCRYTLCGEILHVMIQHCVFSVLMCASEVFALVYFNSNFCHFFTFWIFDRGSAAAACSSNCCGFWCCHHSLMFFFRAEEKNLLAMQKWRTRFLWLAKEEIAQKWCSKRGKMRWYLLSTLDNFTFAKCNSTISIFRWLERHFTVLSSSTELWSIYFFYFISINYDTQTLLKISTKSSIQSILANKAPSSIA